jgi:DNA modification methylase
VERTFLLLANTQAEPLPAAFQDDDVRYPVALARHFIDEFTRPGDRVFDPFAGFGTTLLAAEAAGRIPLGLEYDPARVAYVRERLADPAAIIHGDARRLASYGLPPIDLCMTSPPYMTRDDPEDPLTAYTTAGAGYDAYLAGLRDIFAQAGAVLRPGARAVIEVANLKRDGRVTTLAWDLARVVADALVFEGEVVVGWDHYGYGYDHSYCLVFRRPA